MMTSNNPLAGKVLSSLVEGKVAIVSGSHGGRRFGLQINVSELNDPLRLVAAAGTT